MFAASAFSFLEDVKEEEEDEEGGEGDWEEEENEEGYDKVQWPSCVEGSVVACFVQWKHIACLPSAAVVRSLFRGAVTNVDGSSAGDVRRTELSPKSRRHVHSRFLLNFYSLPYFVIFLCFRPPLSNWYSVLCMHGKPPPLFFAHIANLPISLVSLCN